MKLRVFSKHTNKEGKAERIVFEVLNNTAQRELIIVNIDTDDPIMAYKKELIGDTLYMIVHDEAETSWAQINTIIKEIMDTKIHLF